MLRLRRSQCEMRFPSDRKSTCAAVLASQQHVPHRNIISITALFKLKMVFRDLNSATLLTRTVCWPDCHCATLPMLIQTLPAAGRIYGFTERAIH